MPIEKIEGMGSKSDSTEWCTYYPCGLNDNVKGVGNISKMKGELVVNMLFNRQKRTFKARKHIDKRSVTYSK